jgi:hypothetical protein
LQIEWKWGPVTQYRLDLDGVDSQGESGGDVMEIIGMTDSLQATQVRAGKTTRELQAVQAMPRQRKRQEREIS